MKVDETIMNGPRLDEPAEEEVTFIPAPEKPIIGVDQVRKAMDTLKKYNNRCPVMISSSIQATLAGRFGTSEYGKSKKAGEELMFSYGEETGSKVLVYRFPNLFGKWCRPNYNSAVATFCNNIANDLPIQVNDPSVEMELLYIDDLVDEMIGRRPSILP